MTNAVSTAVVVRCGDPSEGVSTSSWDTKIKGLSIMATQRAIALVTPQVLGSGGSMEETSISQSIVSSSPLSETE